VCVTHSGGCCATRGEARTWLPGGPGAKGVGARGGGEKSSRAAAAKSAQGVRGERGGISRWVASWAKRPAGDGGGFGVFPIFYLAPNSY
jgi:hypothetical protein